MKRHSDPISEDVRSLLLAVGVHLIALGLIVSGISWTQSTAVQPSVEGEMIEVAMLPAPAPPKAAKAKPVERPKPPEPEPAKPKEEPKPVVDDKPPTPPAPPPGKDNSNQEEVSRLAIAEKAKAEREQQERIKREQELLEQHQKQVKMDEEKAKQLEDIRKARLAAEERRRLEEMRLAEIKKEQAELAKRTPPKPEQPPAPKLGNGGTDDDLAARWQLAVKKQVTDNWRRSDDVENVRCAFRITLIPGGQVASVVQVPPCNATESAQRSMESAIRIQDLPWDGYEKVAQKNFIFTFCQPETYCQR